MYLTIICMLSMLQSLSLIINYLNQQVQ